MKFNFGKTFLLGLGFFGVSVIWSVYNAFVPVFLADRFLMAAGFIGIFMTLDNIAALLIQPAVGAWSDRLRTPIGRRMPFILVGAPLAAVAFVMLPVAQSLIVFFLSATMLLLSMAIWRTPVVALMPDITPSKFRSQANGIINFMGGLGAIIAFLLGSSLYKQNPNFPFWMGSGLVILAAVLVFIFIKEPKEYQESEKQPDLFASLREVWRDSDKSALRLFLAIFFWFVGYNAIEAFFTLYSVNHLNLNEADGAGILGHLSLLFVIFALIAGLVGSKLGRRVTISIGLILLVLMIGVMFFLPPETLGRALTKLPVLGTLRVISIPMMVAGIGWALININSLPMVVDLVEDVRIGTFTGLYYLFSTLAAIAGPNVNGWIIQVTGNNYGSIMWVAPIFMITALVLMWGVRRGEAKTGSLSTSTQ